MQSHSGGNSVAIGIWSPSCPTSIPPPLFSPSLISLMGSADVLSTMFTYLLPSCCKVWTDGAHKACWTLRHCWRIRKNVGEYIRWSLGKCYHWTNDNLETSAAIPDTLWWQQTFQMMIHSINRGIHFLDPEAIPDTKPHENLTTYDSYSQTLNLYKVNNVYIVSWPVPNKPSMV